MRITIREQQEQAMRGYFHEFYKLFVDFKFIL